MEWDQLWLLMRYVGDLFIGMSLTVEENPSIDGQEFIRQLDVSIQRFLKLYLLRAKWQADGRIDIKSLIDYAQSCKYSDERDQVYAFLGLAEYALVLPDYSPEVSVGGIYIEAAKNVILHERGFDIMLHAENNGKGHPKLPSWVPNWSVAGNGYQLTQPKEFMNISRGKFARPIFLPHASSRPHCVRTHVVMIDRVALDNAAIQDMTADGKTRDDGVSTKRVNGIFFSHCETVEDDASKALKATLSRQNSMKTVFVSPKGFTGRTSSAAKPTDSLCIFIGSSVPSVIRKEEDHYVFVCAAYIHGLMGEYAIDMVERGELSLQCVKLY
ncbi:hypothetical protein M501DRAFT_1018540 [Patellaria atrata CBS 101060]|uniref:Heterokaryon incompatibility domain-containing protein n=1 Tax=Patellaria atrata CBS 101060 TaxID=1346257 RepID=A0A9P4S5T4_9PEZI|nr:hypothetical protein M501DRAFT_1018540 [Patellaria atrata CBS 101060]